MEKNPRIKTLSLTMATGNKKPPKNPKFNYPTTVFGRNEWTLGKERKKEELQLYNYSGLSIIIKVLLLKFEF